MARQWVLVWPLRLHDIVSRRVRFSVAGEI